MRTFNLVPKLVLITFGTRPKVFKAKNTIIRAFDLVPKSVPTTFGTRPKVFKLIELVPVANF
jgi:UDP-N-acetylglucosamine 2-epimerase